MFKEKSFFLIIVLLFLSFSLQAQTKKQWMNYGDKSFTERDYYGASLYYKEALKKDTADINLVYKYAESLRSYNEYYLAKRYYEYLYKLDKGEQYPEALYWMGTMQKHNADYPAAKRTFQTYIAQSKEKETFFYRKAVQELVSCDFAIQLVKKPINVSVQNLGEPVNSENSEFSPMVIDSVLYFSSLRADKITELNEVEDKKYVIEIFNAKGSSKDWTVTGTIDSAISNAGFHIANGCFSPVDNSFYFSVCDSNFQCALYYTDRKKGTWSVPKALPETINMMEYTATQPMLALIEGKEVLFFSSNRKGSIGKMDIWYSVKQGAGWSEPVNAGKLVNTIDDEVCPWYDESSKTLYFSSGWHPGLGGFDIFRSKGNLLSLGQPENIGAPFNSSANDFYFTHYSRGDSSKGFLTSNRKGSITKKGETCCNDIWMWEHPLPPVEKPIENNYEKIIALNSKRPVLYFHNDEPSPNTLDTIVSIAYDESWKRYIGLQEEYLRQNKDEDRDTVNKFFKDKVLTGMTHLEEFSKLLVEALAEGKKIRIYVTGHASPLAKTDYNANLSKRRISTFVNYLSEFNQGKLKGYLSDSSLIIQETPLGEADAATGVSDNLNDKKRSVYSVEASLERRVSVEKVELISSEIKYGAIGFINKYQDFGQIEEEDEVSFDFKFKNYGNRNLKILNIVSPCGCTTPKYSKDPVGPGEEGTVTINFNSKGKKGPQNKIIKIYSDAENSPQEIRITGVVK